MKRKRLRGKALRKLQRARKAAKLLAAEHRAPSRPIFFEADKTYQIRLLGNPLPGFPHHAPKP